MNGKLRAWGPVILRDEVPCSSLLRITIHIFILGTLKNSAVSELGTSFYGAEEGWKQRMKGTGGLKVTSFAKWKLGEAHRKTANPHPITLGWGLPRIKIESTLLRDHSRDHSCLVHWTGLLGKSGCCLWFFWRSDNNLVSVWVAFIGVTVLFSGSLVQNWAWRPSLLFTFYLRLYLR